MNQDARLCQSFKIRKMNERLHFCKKLKKEKKLLKRKLLKKFFLIKKKKYKRKIKKKKKERKYPKIFSQMNVRN